MIYTLPAPEEPIDQGDILAGCPLVFPKEYNLDASPAVRLNEVLSRVIVLTQTCDFANDKTIWVLVGLVLDARAAIDQAMLKAVDIKGPVRAGRVWGWYYLPRSDAHGLPEMIVDLRQLHTVRLDMLVELCRRGQRQARLQPLYREHLGKHFGDTYSRIGLPEPYPTD